MTRVSAMLPEQNRDPPFSEIRGAVQEFISNNELHFATDTDTNAMSMDWRTSMSRQRTWVSTGGGCFDHLRGVSVQLQDRPFWGDVGA